MCEIAVKKHDNSSDIPEEGRWMAGDIVTVCCEGHPWTEKERELFHIVKLPGVSVEEALSYCKPLEDEREKDGEVTPDRGHVRARSQFKLDLDKRCFACKKTGEEKVLEDLVEKNGGDPEKMQPEFRRQGNKSKKR